jgi:multidrug efflux pump subunit AcrA (membrane-fusion protein)
MAAVDCPVLNETASRPTELDDLQDHALGQVGKLQSDAQAEADALRSQVTEQGQALQQQAQAKVDELRDVPMRCATARPAFATRRRAAPPACAIRPCRG